MSAEPIPPAATPVVPDAAIWERRSGGPCHFPLWVRRSESVERLLGPAPPAVPVPAPYVDVTTPAGLVLVIAPLTVPTRDCDLWEERLLGSA
jgi:hypothetical protein